MSKNRAHHVLASRALVRARLGQWDAALVDAERVHRALPSHMSTLTPCYTKSLKIQRSLVGYIAKCVARVGKGEIRAGCRVCDIAFLRFPSDSVSLLLIKVLDSTHPWPSFNFFPFQAVALFMAGEHDDAISRMDDLTTEMCVDPALYVVQARGRCPYIRWRHS